MTNYAIIGNSMAANAAASRIHSLDPESPITLISDEPDLFYSRCGLMYYVMDHCWKRDLYIADREHYRRLNATLVHDKVTRVNAEAHELQLENMPLKELMKLANQDGLTLEGEFERMADRKPVLIEDIKEDAAGSTEIPS